MWYLIAALHINLSMFKNNFIYLYFKISRIYISTLIEGTKWSLTILTIFWKYIIQINLNTEFDTLLPSSFW